jgi:hypothetical protein
LTDRLLLLVLVLVLACIDKSRVLALPVASRNAERDFVCACNRNIIPIYSSRDNIFNPRMSAPSRACPLLSDLAFSTIQRSAPRHAALARTIFTRTQIRHAEPATSSATATKPNNTPASIAKPTTKPSDLSKLDDEPSKLEDDDPSGVDWSSSFKGLSIEPFSKEAADVLQAPLDKNDIEIKPDGIIYLPEIKYRRILNKAFGPGGWGLAPRGETIVTDKSITREYALLALGRYGALSRLHN